MEVLASISEESGFDLISFLIDQNAGENLAFTSSFCEDLDICFGGDSGFDDEGSEGQELLEAEVFIFRRTEFILFKVGNASTLLEARVSTPIRIVVLVIIG